MEEENKLEKNPKLIKGAELKGKEFVRICNPNKIHNNYEWHDGENIDILPFIAKGECQKGGLYFTTIEHLFYYNDYTFYLGDHWFVTLTVDDDEDVWQEPDGKWKAHRVMVTSMTRIKDMPEEVLYQMTKSHLQRRSGWISKQFDPNNREELWCELLELRSHFLQFVRNQTYRMCWTAVRDNNCVLSFVYDPAMVVKFASELDIVYHITDWTCDLVDAFMASGQYTVGFQLCYDDGLFRPCYPGNLEKMLTLDTEHDHMLRVVISKTGSSSETCITNPTQELIDHIYDKVYQNNELLE